MFKVFKINKRIKSTQVIVKWYIVFFLLGLFFLIIFPVKIQSKRSYTKRTQTFFQISEFTKTEFCSEPIPFYRPNVQSGLKSEYLKINTHNACLALKPSIEKWVPVLPVSYTHLTLPTKA